MKIKILGTGCPSCIRLEENTKEALKELNKEVEVEKVTDIAKIISYGIMSIPAIVIDEQVVSYGKVLSPKEIKRLLE